MPVLSLAQIASYATQMAQTPLVELSVASQYINLAYNIVSLERGVEHTPREQLAFASTSTITGRIALPSDHDYTLGIKIAIPNSWSTATSRTTEWKPLLKQPAQWFDAAESYATGEPERYADYATWLEFDPSPDSVYSLQLRYVRKISELTTSTATPLLDEQWHWAMVLKAAELLSAGFTSDMTRERQNQARYAAFVGGLRLDQTKKRMDPRGMRVQYQRSVK